MYELSSEKFDIILGFIPYKNIDTHVQDSNHRVAVNRKVSKKRIIGFNDKRYSQNRRFIDLQNILVRKYEKI